MSDGVEQPAEMSVSQDVHEPENSSPAEEAESAPEAGDAATRSVAEQKVVAKFLMSNAAAGSIIGKGGANISEFQSQSSARIQLSRTHEFFPGTNDRIMLVSGTVNQVLTALHLVLAKIKGEQAVAESMLARDGKSTQLRLLVPSQLCGTIIGKGGATIKSFAEDSKAQIGVSPQDKQPPGVADRVVRITGDMDQLMRAVALIVTKLSENPNYTRFTTNTVSYHAAMPMGGGGGGGGGFRNGGGGGGMGVQLPPFMAAGNGAGPSDGGEYTQVTIPVPEARVGAVIGKSGEVISQMKNVVGVRIRISDRGDFMPGTRNRKVTISGTPEAVQIAQVLINQKVANAAPPPPRQRRQEQPPPPPPAAAAAPADALESQAEV